MGMDISAVISVLKVVVAELPDAVKTGEELVDLGTKFYESANGHVPSIEESVQLRAAVDADVAEALEPLPPAQPGDSDYMKPAAPIEFPGDAPSIVPDGKTTG